MAEPALETTGAPDPTGTPDPSQGTASAATSGADPAAELAAARAELQSLRDRVGQGPLSDMLRHASGDAIAGAVQSYLRMKADPKLGTLIAQYEATGAVPGAGSEPPPEEYLTDEQKEIRSLKSELQQLRAGQNELVLSSGQQALESHFARFLQEYPLEAGEVSAVRGHLAKSFEEWARQGETGMRALRNLQRADSYDQVEQLMLGAMSKVAKDALWKLGERRASRRQGHLELLRTDDRGGVPASDEPLPEFKGANAALKALQFAKSHPERNPHRGRY